MQNKIPASEIDRRRFVQASFLLAGVPPLCCRTPEVPHQCLQWKAEEVVIDLSLAAFLDEPGTAGAIVNSERKVNLIVARTSPDQFVALDRSCTHGAGQCTYNHKRKSVQCTSLNHAEYSLDGTLLHGRTHGNLRSYPVRFSGNTVVIQLGGPR